MNAVKLRSNCGMCVLNTLNPEEKKKEISATHETGEQKDIFFQKKMYDADREELAEQTLVGEAQRPHTKHDHAKEKIQKTWRERMKKK